MSAATRIIYSALEEVLAAEVAAGDDAVPISDNMRLYGEGGCLDSMALVSLITAIEQRLEDEFNLSITLADEKAISARRSPFATPASIAAFVAAQLTGEVLP